MPNLGKENQKFACFLGNKRDSGIGHCQKKKKNRAEPGREAISLRHPGQVMVWNGGLCELSDL